jgi:hypothetical protein
VLKVKEIVFVDNVTGEVHGECKALWINGVGLDGIPADGGPVADAIQELCPPGCHVELRDATKQGNERGDARAGWLDAEFLTAIGESFLAPRP